MRETKLRNIGIFMGILLVGVFQQLSAQENPPIPVEVEVRAEQFLNFGTFTVGTNGGVVRVSPNGNRTSESGIYLLGGTYSYAIFDVYANLGTIIQIQPHSEVRLVGPPGSDVKLQVDIYQDISTGPTFIVTKSPEPVIVGGSLHISSQDAGPAGHYNGSLHLTFIHQ